MDTARDIKFSRCGCRRHFVKSFSVAYPVNAQVSSLFEFGYTITKSGAVFSHGGGAVGNRKGIVTGKNWGLSIAVGRMASNCTVEEVDKFVQGGTWGASLYRGIGGGIATNSLGTAFETGFGFGGGAIDYTYSEQFVLPRPER